MLPSQSLTVETKLVAHARVGTGSTGAFVGMGDPLDLKGDPGISSNLVEEDDSIAVEAVSWGGAKHVYR